MKFLNFEYRANPLEIAESHEKYKKYLAENKELFPTNAFDFATADWHYDNNDPRCPHDSWINSLQVFETNKHNSPKDRIMEIRINLLGAYHDGEIEITYQGIKGYNFSLIPNDTKLRTHGDWLIDEIYLAENGWLIHEIKFWRFGEWQIECEDIKYEWKPVDTSLV